MQECNSVAPMATELWYIPVPISDWCCDTDTVCVVKIPLRILLSGIDYLPHSQPGFCHPWISSMALLFITFPPKTWAFQVKHRRSPDIWIIPSPGFLKRITPIDIETLIYVQPTFHSSSSVLLRWISPRLYI